MTAAACTKHPLELVISKRVGSGQILAVGLESSQCSLTMIAVEIISEISQSMTRTTSIQNIVEHSQ